MITKEDVVQVATGIKQTLTDLEIVEALKRYNEQSSDELWSYIVEDIIYQLIDERK